MNILEANVAVYIFSVYIQCIHVVMTLHSILAYNMIQRKKRHTLCLLWKLHAVH